MSWKDNIKKADYVWIVKLYDDIETVFSSEDRLQDWIRKTYNLDESEDVKRYYALGDLRVMKYELDKEPTDTLEKPQIPNRKNRLNWEAEERKLRQFMDENEN